ncbi:hypothetical protein BN946_scf184746.g27 [Trametes cinnabarina]|uniref:Uncharacterized protein n=1 Tax=Pycnoporus cinnabarinus TaxID=5643 RepID=A0A060S5B2_PYCCI|nr:hypothetical protein BN946_scf184746.g27 [Trametes cinnabarina]
MTQSSNWLRANPPTMPRKPQAQMPMSTQKSDKSHNASILKPKKRKEPIIESSNETGDEPPMPVLKKKRKVPPAISSVPSPSPPPPPSNDLDNIITQVVDMLDPNANYLTRVHNGFESLYQYARLLPRVLGPYIKIETAFLKGGALAARPGYLDNFQPGEKFDADEECAHSYRLIADIWPLLIDSENYLRTNPDTAVKVLDFINKAAARA